MRCEQLNYELVCKNGVSLPVLINATAVLDDLGHLVIADQRLQYLKAGQSRADKRISQLTQAAEPLLMHVSFAKELL